MTRRNSLPVAAATLLLAASTAIAEDEAPAPETTPAASVSDLAWMTGTWSGPLPGGEVLEENWTVPKAGSIQSLVRSTGPNGTSMFELIVIEEEEGTLRLRLQQWDPGMKPRTAGPSVMTLAEMGENTVAFHGEEGAMFDKLRYTRDGDNFTISITFPNGNQFDIPLKAAD
ncbi:MAG: DUF6265 family protein [Gammaproteobacteria bacterium]|nr:DUF6265 family protein [Gammaproteobacteria bacterium]MDE0444774.1 DUF6265 family protein [Gammaproteobacteria bacterium]